jgi:acyl-[acyl-carrier-protein] desaturase
MYFGKLLVAGHRDPAAGKRKELSSMTGSSVLREKMYRAYLEFFEVAETKRRWNIFDDVPWEALDSSVCSERKAACIETFCAEELYLPDYTAGGIELARSMFGTAWFQACWSYEESKHGLVLREYLTRSGQRSESEFAAFEERIFSRAWHLPFQTRRQMACYGALQEAATFLAYKAQKDKAVSEGDKVLEAIFFLLSRDEAAHAGFYRAVVELELDEDRQGTLDDLAYVIANFKMPGDGLIPDYQERLRTTGAGISARTFMERGLLPMLRTLGTSRAELKAATARLSAAGFVRAVAAPAFALAPAK